MEENRNRACAGRRLQEGCETTKWQIGYTGVYNRTLERKILQMDHEIVSQIDKVTFRTLYRDFKIQSQCTENTSNDTSMVKGRILKESGNACV